MWLVSCCWKLISGHLTKLALLVGLTATVYQTSLIDSGLYVILVICSINMSRDATQLRSYLAVCENRLPIHNLYKNHCGVVEDIADLKAKIAIQASVKRCSRKWSLVPKTGSDLFKYILLLIFPFTYIFLF